VRGTVDDVRQRKTDYGTVVLRWLAAIALAIAFVTGLRIATETPEHTWIHPFDFAIPYERVWTTHMQAAVVLIGVSIAYAVYVIRAGLVRRVQLDRMRLRGLATAPTCAGLLAAGRSRWRVASTPAAHTTFRSRPALACMWRPSITAKSGLPGMSGQSILKWNEVA
jgi:hypothetical protein